MIIAPMRFKTNVKEQVFDEQNHPVKGEDGKPLTEDVVREYQTFRPAYVFDYSDTDGEPLPTLATMLDEKVDSFETLKEVLIKVSPVPITFEEIQSAANGYFSPSEMKIVVKEGLPELQTIKTMIHEIGHASLGHGGKEDKWDRETKEVQAESVAYWVSQMIGLDTSDYSFGYISGWSKDKKVSELKDNLEIIKKTADEISSAIEAELAKRQEKKQEPTFEIYQLNEKANRELSFSSYSVLEKLGVRVDPSNYDLVYSSPLKESDTLDSIYETFNINHPEDFKGHSLSVSDIVVLHKDEKDVAWYVDSFGFHEAPDFLCKEPVVTKLKSDAKISYYYAENMEFETLGYSKDGLTLEEAFKLFDSYQHGGIGFDLEDGSDYAGKYELMSGGQMHEDLINMIEYYRQNPLVQEAIKGCREELNKRSGNEQQIADKPRRGKNR